MIPTPAYTLSVPVELAIEACTELALTTLQAWLERGARLEDRALVYQVGNRLMARIEFKRTVAAGKAPCDAVLLPLIVTLCDGEPGAAMLARIRAADSLRDRLTAALEEAGRP